MVGELASTSRIRQFGQVAETMARSRAISLAQPGSALVSGETWPLWLTLRKQPLAVVQGGRP